ncbi:MAG TPA: hypothetical protein VGY56_01090 [Verrucomicrobiae bacterium]|nr:hypothetical protein [Verrucomicrobiae bacterium]
MFIEHLLVDGKNCEFLGIWAILTIRAGTIKATWVGGIRPGASRKGRPEEGETGGSIAVRDERDDQMNCGAAKDGYFNARQPLAILAPA